MVGTWSLDCADNHLAHIVMTFPYFGNPTRAAIMPDDGRVLETWTVTNAKLVTDDKLTMTTVADRDEYTRTTQAVYGKVMGKLVGIRSTTTVVAKKDVHAKLFSSAELHAGDTVTFKSSEDGVSYGYDGRALGPAVLEHCRD